MLALMFVLRLAVRMEVYSKIRQAQYPERKMVVLMPMPAVR